MSLHRKAFTVINNRDENTLNFNFYLSTRQILRADLELVQATCGFVLSFF